MQLVKQQHTNDCGVAVLMMVAEYHGKECSMEELTERCHLTRDGVSLYDLQQTAESIGLRTLAIRCTVKELVERVPLPAIVLWTNNHYVVVDEADDSRIHVLDPARGSMWYSHEDFQRGWYQEDKQTGVLMVVEPCTSKETKEDTLLHNSMTMQNDEIKNTNIHWLIQRKLTGEDETAMKDSEWNELATMLNDNCQGFTRKLKELHPMNESELRVSMLLKAGFSPKQIARLCCITTSGVSNIRSRLVEKIMHLSAVPKAWDQFIQKL